MLLTALRGVDDDCFHCMVHGVDEYLFRMASYVDDVALQLTG